MFKYLEHFRSWFIGVTCISLGYYLGQTSDLNLTYQKVALWIATISLLVNFIVSTRALIKKECFNKE